MLECSECFEPICDGESYLRISGQTRAVVKYPGAKWRIAPWIIERLPAHHSYLEPYFGSGAVLFCKPASRIETINDLDGDVVNLFRIIRNNPEPLCRAVAMTPYSRQEYDASFTEEPAGEIEQARRFLIRCWMGHGFRTCEKSGWKNDVAGREAAYAVRNWQRLPAWLEAATERLRQVQIECRPALELIERFNRPNVLIYADPPYLISTRKQKQYRFEMGDMKAHTDLLEAVLRHKGPVAISGYDSDLYNEALQGWEKHQIKTTTEKGLPRVEILWVKT
jgi:DNA adenine methylase